MRDCVIIDDVVCGDPPVAAWRKAMRASLFLPLLAACLLSACASQPAVTEAPKELLAGPRFGPPTERISTDDVLAVSDAMKRYLAVDIADQIRVMGPQTGLITALFERTQLKLEYDATRTKTAAEAFASRSGNCLSLVLMTAALAHQLNLRVVYQSAYLDPTWSRSGDLLFAAGHVNITVGRRLMDVYTSRDLSPLTVDFLPPAGLRRMATREIGEMTVLAMYENNRAAEALLDGRIDDAYAWAVAALHEDPSYLVAYNTLGVVYMRHGDTGAASQVFDYVLAREPKNTRAMANLAETDDRLGRKDAADALRVRLAAIESDPPFHFFTLGLDAMRREDYLAARDYFSREVKRADYYHEFHFWLGLADWRLGDETQARKQLELAIDNSTTRPQRDLYAAKLEWLQAHRQQ
jgi:Tfp pilus assembly protein PilF